MLEKIIIHLPLWCQKKYYEYKFTHHYDDMVVRAEQFHRNYDGERVYLIAIPSGNLILLTREGFREAKRKGFINKMYTMNDIKECCVYYTATRFENTPMGVKERDEKRKEYIKGAVNIVLGLV